MNAAGPTHGGFYRYFGSKNELIAGALADVLSKRPVPTGDLADFAASYLSAAHRDNRAGTAKMMRWRPAGPTLKECLHRHQAPFNV